MIHYHAKRKKKAKGTLYGEPVMRFWLSEYSPNALLTKGQDPLSPIAHDSIQFLNCCSQLARNPRLALLSLLSQKASNVYVGLHPYLFTSEVFWDKHFKHQTLIAKLARTFSG
jgi:hypothetical protein